jgi:hypothetical protein
LTNSQFDKLGNLDITSSFLQVSLERLRNKKERSLENIYLRQMIGLEGSRVISLMQQGFSLGKVPLPQPTTDREHKS